ncbi:MFS transporter [Rhodococcus ruber]|uniref:MFS transporter n=1 Tax=Rhodococcus ruber TaxID=1830 RepID=UPI001FC95F31|nr:MFS transporter [Rhodococcus ruber]
MEKSSQIVVGTEPPSAGTPAHSRTRPLRRVVGSATAGTFIEYYDFAIYGSMAPVLSMVFFPSSNPVTGLLKTFAVFAIAFVARPLGGLIWGPLGDRIGRKRTLAAIILLISIATVLIGVTPSYAAIGLAAPVLLVIFRLLQGISAGGEMAGAAVFVAEHAPPKQRGYMISWLQVAAIAAFLSGIIVSAVVTAVLSEAALNSWGWRIPFLLAGPMGLIGLYIRFRVEETPKFEGIEDAEGTGPVRRRPLKELLTAENLREMGWASAYFMPVLVPYYLLMTFMPTYLKTEGHFTASASLGIIVLAGLVQLGTIPLFGKLADKIGRRMLLRAAMLWFLVFTWPAFALLASGDAVLTILGLLLLALPTAASQANSLSPVIERFRTRVRFTAAAVTLGVLSAVFAGTTPYISTFLIDATGSVFAPGFYMLVTLVPSLVVSFFVTETARTPLRD